MLCFTVAGLLPLLVVADFQCSDLDTDFNTLEYILAPSTGAQFFTVPINTGQLFLNGEFWKRVLSFT